MGILDGHSLVRLKAFEELHAGDIVRLYYGKLKKMTKTDSHKKAVGIVIPLVNPKVIPRNDDAVIGVCGMFYLPTEEEE